MRKHLQGRGHPPALLFFTAWIAWTALLHGGVVRAQRPPVARDPLVFRMDALAANLTGHAIRGQGNVVMRQEDWLFCCDRFEAQGDGRGQWRSVRCTGRLRGYHQGRRLWADAALFTPNSHVLTLTGNPRLALGEAATGAGAQTGQPAGELRGNTITLNTATRDIAIDGPRGNLATQTLQALRGQPDLAAPDRGAEPPFLTGPLPDSCPFPWP